MKINIVGDFFGQTGYANHTRQFANALNKLVEVSMECQKPQNWVKYVNDDELKMLLRNTNDYDVRICITTPTYWKLFWNDDKPFIGVCVWEGDRIPMSWCKILLDNKVSQIWCPSSHTRTAIRNTITEYNNFEQVLGKTFIIPHGVDLNIFYPKQMDRDKRFTFFANKGYRGMKDRGGLQYLFKAFKDEFKSNENVILLVKINTAYGVVNFQKEGELLKLNPNGAQIKLLADNYSYERLNDLYNQCDVFVTTSQAEAFNLPCLEAMACGKPVIATMFGGQSDYVNNSVGWQLETGTSKEVTWDILYEGIEWKEPDIMEIRQKLRYVYEHRDEVINKGNLALSKAKELTWDNSAKLALENIKSISKIK